MGLSALGLRTNYNNFQSNMCASSGTCDTHYSLKQYTPLMTDRLNNNTKKL